MSRMGSKLPSYEQNTAFGRAVFCLREKVFAQSFKKIKKKFGTFSFLLYICRCIPFNLFVLNVKKQTVSLFKGLKFGETTPVGSDVIIASSSCKKSYRETPESAFSIEYVEKAFLGCIHPIYHFNFL